MTALIIIAISISGVSLIFNVGYIVHELGWIPRGKRRDKPIDVSVATGPSDRLPEVYPGEHSLAGEALPAELLQLFPTACEIDWGADLRGQLDPMLDIAAEDLTPGDAALIVELIDRLGWSSGEHGDPIPNATIDRAVSLIGLSTQPSTAS